MDPTQRAFRCLAQDRHRRASDEPLTRRRRPRIVAAGRRRELAQPVHRADVEDACTRRRDAIARPGKPIDADVLAVDARQRCENGAGRITGGRAVGLTTYDVRKRLALPDFLRAPSPELRVADLERAPRRDAVEVLADQSGLRVVGRRIDEPIGQLVRRIVLVQLVVGLAHFVPAQGRVQELTRVVHAVAAEVEQVDATVDQRRGRRPHLHRPVLVMSAHNERSGLVQHRLRTLQVLRRDPSGVQALAVDQLQQALLLSKQLGMHPHVHDRTVECDDVGLRSATKSAVVVGPGIEVGIAPGVVGLPGQRRRDDRQRMQSEVVAYDERRAGCNAIRPGTRKQVETRGHIRSDAKRGGHRP